MPYQARLIDFVLSYQVADVEEDQRRRQRLVQLRQLRPDFGRGRRLLLGDQEIQECGVDIRRGMTSRSRSVDIRLDPPAKPDRSRRQVGIAFHDHAKFPQRLIGVALYQIEIARLPGQIGGGGVGHEAAFQRRFLRVGVAQELIRPGQIEPVTRLIWIQADGGAKGLHRSFGRSLDQEEIASQAMAIVRVARLPADRSLQTGKIGPAGKVSAPELRGRRTTGIPRAAMRTPAPGKLSWQDW